MKVSRFDNADKVSKIGLKQNWSLLSSPVITFLIEEQYSFILEKFVY